MSTPLRLGLSVGGLACAIAGPALGTAPQRPLEPGGSNYVAYYVTPRYLAGPPPGAELGSDEWLEWAVSFYFPAGLLSPVGHYHLNPDLVRRQLREMFAAGQRKIALVVQHLEDAGDCSFDGLWEVSIAGRPIRPGPASHSGRGGWAHAVILTPEGRLDSLTRSNLASLVSDIKAVGFTQLIFRFGPGGRLDPRFWSEWSEERYAKNRDFAFYLRAFLDSLAGPDLEMLYDLGSEFATYLYRPECQREPCGPLPRFGQTIEYCRRLWRDWLERFGRDNARSYGFSFGNRLSYRPGRSDALVRMVQEVYDVAGGRPFAYAFDIYPGTQWVRDYRDFFRQLRRQLEELGEGDKPIVIQEALYNDSLFARAVRYARRELGLDIRYIMQWAASDPGRHYTVSYPKDYSSYLPEYVEGRR